MYKYMLFFEVDSNSHLIKTSAFRGPVRDLRCVPPLLQTLPVEVFFTLESSELIHR